MSGLFGALAKEGAIGFVALIVLVALVWFGGQILGLTVQVRAIIIVVILALWILLFIARKVMAVKATMEIEKRLRGQAQEQMAGVRPDKKPEIQALDAQLAAAIQSLKTSKLGNGALYALPWYIIIGPPGSGKSTALQESGLNFPYANQGGKGIRGVGGTRNCDWWFTDQGILLDTAGRYTTELDDRDEWLAFLDMLKKSRSKKPINGAMVAIAVSDILKGTDEELQRHAKNIRDRIDELTKNLEVTFPIYLLFTKCDLMHGFTDFFEDMNKDQRSQVWGVTLPYKPHGAQELKTIFETECKKLYETLCYNRVGSLSTDRKAEKKRNIYTFPIQYAIAQKRLTDFVGMLFQDNPFQESSLFRGFYFTSGTQEGTPIDQVVASMGRALGMTEGAEQLMSQEVEKKSYFLNQLFMRVIFPDQVLARSSTAVERRRWFLRLAALFGSVAGTIAMIVVLIVSFIGNRRIMNGVEETGKNLKDTARTTDWSRLSGHPQAIESNLEALDALRAELKDLDDFQQERVPWRLRWGLYSGQNVAPAGRKLYFEKLEKAFVKPVGERLIGQMKDIEAKHDLSIRDYTRLRELFRAYMMIIRPLPIKPDLQHLRSFLAGWWVECAKSPEGTIPDAVRKLADNQFDFWLSQLQLLRDDCPRLDLDTGLQSEIREILKIIPMIPQSYANLEDFYKSRWSDKIGPDQVIGKNALYFKGPDVSNYFTMDAWNKDIKKAFETESTRLVEGDSELKIVLNMTAKEVNDKLTDMYLARYSEAWLGFLGKLQLREMTGLDDTESLLILLSSQNDSPYNPLFNEVWQRMKPRPQGVLPALNGIDRLKDGIAKLLKIKTADPIPDDQGKDLAWRADAYAALKKLHDVVYGFCKAGDREEEVRAYLRTKFGKPGEDAFIVAEQEMRKALAGIDPVVQNEVTGIMLQPIRNARKAVVNFAQTAIDHLWKTQVADIFQKSLASKFPFKADATDDVTFDDFTDFFKPDGIFWKVYGDNLKVWRDKLDKPEEVVILFSKDCLQTIDYFIAVSEAFFPNKAPDPSLSFYFHFTKLSDMLFLQLSVGAYEYAYPERSTQKDWHYEWKRDKDKGANLVIKVGSGPESSSEDGYKFEGTWGFFRLLAAAQKREPQPGKPNYFDMSWNFPKIGKNLDASVYNPDTTKIPYHKDFFTRIVCPAKVGP